MALSLPFLKKSEERNLELFRDITDDVDESEFVPYACLYDPNTIVTKNGELLQTIRITGLSQFNKEGEADLRQVIRNAILKDIDSDRYAIWFHTVRRKRPVRLSEQNIEEPLARYIHQAWRNKNELDHVYVNDVCITVVREGQAAPLLSPVGFLRSLWIPIDRRFREAYLDDSLVKINETVGRLLESLAPYGAKRLGLYEADGVYYSELLEFMAGLINLKDMTIPVPETDLSQFLTMNDVTFGYNAMEVRDHDGKRRFAAVLTIKEYHELSLEAISRFLELPDEFIVTQCIDFINRKEALSGYQYQKHLYSVSGDHHLSEITGLDDIIKSDTGNQLDYGQQQLSVFLQADDMRALERNVSHVIAVLNSLGMIAIREDIKLEECYWAQLPGNFEFIKRLSPINTARAGGFATLSTLPTGKVEYNRWGPAVTTLRTVANTPYFFNFHEGANGHTAVIGQPGTGKTTLVNLLLSEARKFRTKLFLFDASRSSEAFIRGLDGAYQVVSPTPLPVQLNMNPLALDDSEPNRVFLSAWIESLISPQGEPVGDAVKAAIARGLQQVYARDARKRNLRELALSDPTLGKLLAPWIHDGPYANLFDSEVDGFDSRAIQGFDLTSLLAQPHLIAPVLSYLIQRVILQLDGSPAIIVFDKAWTLLDNPLFASRLRGFLKLLMDRNAIAVFMTDSVERAAEKPFCMDLMACTATQIYMPNDLPSDVYKDIFRLDETELRYVEMMSEADRHVLIKRGTENVVVQISFEGIEPLLPVLSSNEQDRERMHAAIRSEGGKGATAWLPHFIQGSMS